MKSCIGSQAETSVLAFLSHREQKLETMDDESNVARNVLPMCQALTVLNGNDEICKLVSYGPSKQCKACVY